jgi:hypothetical protein
MGRHAVHSWHSRDSAVKFSNPPTQSCLYMERRRRIGSVATPSAAGSRLDGVKRLHGIADVKALEVGKSRFAGQFAGTGFTPAGAQPGAVVG